MHPILQRHLNRITDLCERFGVETLYAFGSATSDRFGAESDVDFLVTFKPLGAEEYAESYFQLVEALEELLQRPVDLVTTPSLQNPYFIEEVNRTKQPIYGYRHSEVSV